MKRADDALSAREHANKNGGDTGTAAALFPSLLNLIPNPFPLNGGQATEGKERAERRADETASGVSVDRRV